MGLRDQDLLCALLCLCNGKIYQWKRLKIAIYALSEGGRSEKKRWDPLFSYKFDNWCYSGPNDHQLWRDLIALKFNDYLDFEDDQKVYENTSHSLFDLKEKGILKGQSVLAQMDRSKEELLCRIARDLLDEKLDATSFFAEYATNWEKESLPIATRVHDGVEKEFPELRALS